MVHIQLIDIGLQLSYYCHMPNGETVRKRTLLHESNTPADTNKEGNTRKDAPPIAAVLAKCSIDATELSAQKSHTVEEIRDYISCREQSKPTAHLDLTTEDAQKMLDSGDEVTLLVGLKYFGQLDPTIAQQICDIGSIAVPFRLKQFPGVDYDDITKRMTQAGHKWVSQVGLENFTELNDELAHRMVEAGEGGLALRREEVQITDVDSVLCHLIDYGDVDDVLMAINSPREDRCNSIDITKVVSYIARHKGLNEDDLECIIKNNPSVDRTTVSLALIDHGSADMVFTMLDSMAVDQQRFAVGLADRYEVLLESDVSDETFARCGELMGDKRPDSMVRAEEFFGSATVSRVKLLQEMLDGNVPDTVRQLGVTSAGEAGITELRSVIETFRQAFQAAELDEVYTKQLEESPVLRDVLMTLTGYKGSRWGGNSDAGLQEKIRYHNQAAEDGRIAAMKEFYRPSDVYSVATVAGKKERIGWTPDVIERYDVLRNDIMHARALTGPQGGGMRQAIDELRTDIFVELEDLQYRIDTTDNNDPKANIKVSNLKRRKDALQKYVEQVQQGDFADTTRFVMDSPADFTRGFQELQPYKSLHQSMRRLVYAWAMRKQPDQRREMAGLSVQPSIESLASMREFIEHIVNQEVYGQYFSDKKQANKFKQMNSTRALEEAMNLHQQKAERLGTTTLQFIPTRGILMEMSGQIADACWADKYDSLAEDFPNFTSLMIKARPSKKNERIVGAAMLIETHDSQTGDNVLLVRGLNPTENYIHKIDVGEFYNAVVDYVSKTAEAAGAKPAIVIDDHSGGSTTNRPTLYGYIRAQQPTLPKVSVPRDETFFNTYDVSSKSHLVR